MAMSLVGLAVSALIGSLQVRDPRAPVPDEATLKGAQKEVRDLFKEDFARRDRPGRRSLAERFLREAKGRQFANNKPFLLEFSVRKDGVVVSLDGKQAIRWQGSPSRLGLSDFFKVPRSKALFLGSWESSYRITRLYLTPVTGQGAKLR